MFDALLSRQAKPYSARARSRALRHSALALVICLAGCGRIGVEILPFRNDNGVDPDADNGGDVDGGGSEMDGAIDSDGGVVVDMDGSAQIDAQPDPIALCMMSCQNAHGGASCASV